MVCASVLLFSDLLEVSTNMFILCVGTDSATPNSCQKTGKFKESSVFWDNAHLYFLP